MSESSGSRALVEVIVVAVAAVAIGVLSWLAGAFWWLVKVAIIALVAYLIARLLVRRHR